MFESIALGITYPLGSLNSMMVTGVFIIIMLVLFTIALVASARGAAPSFCRATPTLLTTLGILGTFVGNAIGLLQFDVTHIENSIPALLDGLKLAFITSIVGIILASCLRLVLVMNADASRDHRSDDSNDDGQSMGGSGSSERQTQLAEAQLTLLRQLSQQFIQADEQRSAALETHHRELVTTLDRFANQLAEQGSRQLIAALESVIRDFNHNLGTQFGENFRRLDASVARLLQWQEQYRVHLETLGSQLTIATSGVVKSEAALQSLTAQALQISTHVADQQTTLVSLRRETMELEALLSAIAELREKAQGAFPAMDRRLTTMLETIENAVTSAQRFDQRLQPANSPVTSAINSPANSTLHHSAY
ncbi:hypothetical protein [Thiospirillum jenense]|uniref:hypothetical protein n=1 Tax=Thiospirillum jenense TaxID=1653858 RepID=UPI001EEA73AE|nr:hypothetical protein [Thiospirillum jenense]